MSKDYISAFPFLVFSPMESLSNIPSKVNLYQAKHTGQSLSATSQGAYFLKVCRPKNVRTLLRQKVYDMTFHFRMIAGVKKRKKKKTLSRTTD
jgi:hypothetical protein